MLTNKLPAIARESGLHPLDALVDCLWAEGGARNARSGYRLPKSETIGKRIKTWLKRNGVPATVFGDGDEKTGVPGWYRSVGTVEEGGTCPSRCEHLASRSCYALYNHVGHNGRRSGRDRQAALHAAAGAMVWAALLGVPARGHVSGDLGGDTAEDLDFLYVEGLARIARRVREKLGAPHATVAWTYTHHDPDHDNTSYAIADLAEAGISVRKSDSMTHGGCVTVSDRDHARKLRSRLPTKLAVCPAQLSDTNCAACKLCWTRPEVVVAFIAHGTAKKRASTWSEEMFSE